MWCNSKTTLFSLIQNPRFYGCNTTSYKVIVNHMHINSFVDPMNEMGVRVEEMFILGFYYDSLNVEERVEMLVYDWSAFLASVGGNLGLALGFSCLSICLSLADIVCRKQKF